MFTINVDKVKSILHNRLFSLGDEYNLIYRPHSNQNSIIYTYINGNNMVGIRVP